MTKRELIVLLAACAWISLVVLSEGSLFGRVALSLPALLLAAILYCWFAGYLLRRSYMLLALAMAGCLSLAFFKGYRDCCRPSNYFVLPRITSGGRVIPNGDPVQKLKTPSAVRSEVISYCLPAILFGLVGFWWLKASGGTHHKSTGGAAIVDAEYVDIVGQVPVPRQLDSDEPRKGIIDRR